MLRGQTLENNSFHLHSDGCRTEFSKHIYILHVARTSLAGYYKMVLQRKLRLRQLVTTEGRVVHLGFVVDKVVLEQVFL
jgi:hypothetical protein